MNRFYRFFIRKLNYVLSYDIIEFFLSIHSYFKLRKVDYTENSILIVEPNNFHGEILPGYIYYLNQLNYNSTVLVRRKNYNQGLFTLFNKKELPEIHCINKLFLKIFFRKQPKFDYVFFTSSMISEKNGYFGHVFDFFKNSISGKRGVIYTEHNFDNLIPQLEANSISADQITLLSPLKNETYKNVAVVNPNYFGETKVDLIPKNKKTFITVGSINKRNRNINLLFNMIENIEKDYGDSYEILIVGRGVKEDMFTTIPKQIKILGELSFKELYKALQRSHYFLPLLDPNFDGHKRYLNGETTGSKQLILGFSIIPVIHSKFAAVYGFNNKNAILYDDDFTSAIKQAILLDYKSIRDKRKAIGHLTHETRENSIDNLKKLLN